MERTEQHGFRARWPAIRRVWYGGLPQRMQKVDRLSGRRSTPVASIESEEVHETSGRKLGRDDIGRRGTPDAVRSSRR
jgi:hypothetical protein